MHLSVKSRITYILSGYKFRALAYSVYNVRGMIEKVKINIFMCYKSCRTTVLTLEALIRNVTSVISTYHKRNENVTVQSILQVTSQHIIGP